MHPSRRLSGARSEGIAVRLAPQERSFSTARLRNREQQLVSRETSAQKDQKRPRAQRMLQRLFFSTSKTLFFFSLSFSSSTHASPPSSSLSLLRVLSFSTIQKKTPAVEQQQETSPAAAALVFSPLPPSRTNEQPLGRRLGLGPADLGEKALGRPLHGRHRPAHGEVQRVHRLRQAHVARGHRREPGVRPRPLEDFSAHRGRGGRDRRGPRRRRRGVEGRHLRDQARGRGHPHGEREKADGADRSRRGEAAHGEVEERPSEFFFSVFFSLHEETASTASGGKKKERKRRPRRRHCLLLTFFFFFFFPPFNNNNNRSPPTRGSGSPATSARRRASTSASSSAPRRPGPRQRPSL